MLNTICRSLRDLLGTDYIDAVCRAQAFLTGRDVAALAALADERVDFFPNSVQERLEALLADIGTQVVEGLASSSGGAATAAFAAAQHNAMAPLAGLGFVRIGEDGRAYFIGKSEHYHASLGHSFPGYHLLDTARALGIPNATHNNTRGFITRRLERELIRVANGVSSDDAPGLEQVLASDRPQVLNRVINLETGSLAVEAALKTMLARFYRLEPASQAPVYAGRTPVFLVMADGGGGPSANYHGTTILTQVLRGMWPELGASLEAGAQYVVRPVAINDVNHFQERIDQYDRGPYKVAGFLHELVLMNYGGIRLTPEFVSRTHAVCREHDIPVLVDEIQSCLWSPEVFLFREYNCHPDFVAVGKGFPGGEYAASRVLMTAAMDSLNQFGALVTNGQEELASLAYLITLSFAEANREHTRATGVHYHCAVEKLARDFPDLVAAVEGEAHMTSLFFHTVGQAVAFSRYLTEVARIDVSAQTYKANCPPAALTKLPLVVSWRAIDFVVGKMREALTAIR